MVNFWRFTIIFISFTGYIEPVLGGEFLYIPYKGRRRPNNKQARKVCQSYGPCQLAVIDTQEQYNKMYQHFTQILGEDFDLPVAVWIGLYWIDIKGNGTYKHYWEKSGKMVELTWSYWDINEPNFLGQENCGRIYTNMYIRSIGCEQRYDVLCEGTGSSSCFSTTTETDRENVTDNVAETTTDTVSEKLTETTKESIKENVTSKIIETTVNIGAETRRDNIIENVTANDAERIHTESVKEDIKRKHNRSTRHWWSRQRVGLVSGFSTLCLIIIFCYVGWRCFCATKIKVGFQPKNEIFKVENSGNGSYLHGNDEIKKENDNDYYDRESEDKEESKIEIFNANTNIVSEPCEENNTENHYYYESSIHSLKAKIDRCNKVENADGECIMEQRDIRVDEYCNNVYKKDAEEENDFQEINSDFHNKVYGEDENYEDEENMDDVLVYDNGDIEEMGGKHEAGISKSSKMVKELKGHVISEQTNHKPFCVTSAIPDRKYNSWMSSEDLSHTGGTES